MQKLLFLIIYCAVTFDYLFNALFATTIDAAYCECGLQ